MTTIQQMLLGGGGGPIDSIDFVSFGNKLPIYGTGGGSYPPPGWTGIQNASVDDNWVSISLPFTFYIAGTGYTASYMGSNTYLTFGGGATTFDGLTASNPNLPKFMFGADDNSYQRVSRFASGTAYQRIRYEGTRATGAAIGSPNIVLEITLFNPANYGGYNVLELLTGNHASTGGASLVANSSTAYATYSQSSNASYVFVGDGGGNSWTIYSNSYVNNTDY